MSKGTAMNREQHGSQLYIGTQNGVVVCVNQSCSYNLSGEFYHSYSPDAVPFATLEQLLLRMEELFNRLAFPFPATNERHFLSPEAEEAAAADRPSGPSAGSRAGYTRPEKREKIMKDEELLTQHGDLGSFIIRVQHRQNSSWQGRLTWVEKDQTVNFRSVWEMVKLIDNAINTAGAPKDEAPAWHLEPEDPQ